MTHDVFISYSHNDKPVADAICANLEGAGIRCWIAPRDIAPGLDWPTAISNAISTSHLMVLVFSAHSNSSNDVSRELILAANNNLIIIPFKIDNITPEPGKQYYLARMHWLDAMNPPTQEQIDKLVRYARSFISDQATIGTIKSTPEAKLSSDETVQSSKLVAPPPSLPVKSKRKSRWISGVLLFLAIVGVSIFAIRSFQPIPKPASPTVTNFLTSAAGNSLSEDFSSNANHWKTGKESYDEGTVDYEITGGRYIISMTSKQNYFFVLISIPVFHGKNFTLTIDTTVLDSTVTPGKLTLVFSLRDAFSSDDHRYDFVLGNDGSSRLELWPTGNPQDRSDIWNHNANDLFALVKGVKKTISIKLDGPMISASVNGQKIDSVSDATIGDAGDTTLGICLYNAGETVIIAFDNLIIHETP